MKILLTAILAIIVAGGGAYIYMTQNGARPSLTVSSTFGYAPLKVTFDSRSGGFKIDFGDGSSCAFGDNCPWSHAVEGSDLDFVHTYPSPGVYTATLKDQNGEILGTTNVTVTN